MNSLPEPVSRKSGSCISGQGGLTRSLPEPPSFEHGAGTTPAGPPTSNADVVLKHLPRGRANATSIPALVAATGLTEREVRAAIEELVTLRHLPVCTLPTSRGVWLATTPDEVLEAEAQLRSRAMALLERCRGLRFARERLEYSPTLF